MHNGVLPEGWVWAKLADICEPVTQVDPHKTPDRRIRYVDISSIDNRSHEITEHREILGSEAPSRARKPMRAGDVLFSTVRTYLRNVALVPPAYDNEIASTAFCVLRARKGIEPAYIFRYLLSEEFIESISAKQRGISYPAVTDRDVYAESIPLPPSNEQSRIVEKMESLLQQSRAAREALDRIPPLLQKLRQAVLSRAFRGELTERDPDDEPASVLLQRIRVERRCRWEERLRAQGKDPSRYTYEEPSALDTFGLPELPEGWVWTSLGELINLLQYGTSVKADADSSGVPVLRMGNIQAGHVELAQLKFIDPAKENTPRYLLEDGDILINRTNSPELVGKAAVFRGQDPFVFASYLIRLRANRQIVEPYYLVNVINSEIGRRHVVKVKHQVAGQANINSQNIREMPVPLAPLGEQGRIVSRIQALFRHADAIEAAAKVAHRRLDKLDQAILARAFRGELVAQHSSDELAGVLLQRMQAATNSGSGQRDAMDHGLS